MKRFATVIVGMFAVIVVALIGAALVMDDSDLEGLVASIPGGAPHAADIVAVKRDTYDGIAYWFDDTWYGLRSTWWDASRAPGGGPRVVIHLDPVRTPSPAMPPEPMASPQAMPTPAPVKLVPEHEPNPLPEAQPASPEPSAAEPEPASDPTPKPPPAPAETEAPPPAPPPVAVPAEKVETSVLPEEPAPEKEPAPAETEAEPEVVAKAPPPEKPASPPAPPPAAPETTTGDADHKRGLTHYKDLGVTKNFKTAGEWFEKAAAKGHPAAQYNLGIMSYLGQGREQDYAKAAEWFRMAAEQDHALAQYNLGFLYYEGKGVQKDDLQAFMWIDRAANLGDEKAKKASETLRKILPKDIFEKQ